MTLRSKLLLGYGYLVALLLITAGSAMLGFFSLSEGIDVILDENFSSIRASMQMLEALERQDSATLEALLGDGSGQADAAAREEAFVEHLTAAEANVTEEGEPEILARIREHMAAYSQARDALVAEAPERPMERYRESVQPRFLALKRDVYALLAVNQDAMVRADRNAREAAVRAGTWLGFLVAVALVSLVLLSRALQRQVLEPLAQLRDETAAIGEGDWRRRLNSRGGDELASVARHVNRLLDRLQEAEAGLRSRISTHRRLVLGLLSHVQPGTALYGLKGERLVGELPGGRRVEQEVIGWIRERASDEPNGPGHIAPQNGERFTAELVRFHDRPLAWWVRPAD